MLVEGRNEEAQLSSASGETSLRISERDIRLINSCAAFQLRYGRAEEALAWLGIGIKASPRDAQTLRLLAQAFIQLQDWDRADAAIRALETVAGARVLSPRLLLQKGVILMRRMRMEEARRVFSAFLRLVKGGF